MILQILGFLGLLIVGWLIKFFIDCYLISLKYSKIPGETYFINPIFSNMVGLTNLDFKQFGWKETFRMKEKYGKIHKIQMGRFVMLFVSDVETAKRIAVTNRKQFPKPLAFSKPADFYGEPNIFSLTDEELWRKHRTIVNPAFTDEGLRYVSDCSVDVCNILFESWEKEFEGKSQLTTNLSKETHALTLDIISRAGFDYDTGAVKHLHSKSLEPSKLSRAVEIIFKYNNIVVMLPGFLQNVPFGPAKWLQEGFDIFKTTMEDIVKKRNENLDKHRNKKDILSLLLNSSDSSNEKLNDNQLYSEMIVFLVAGHETTANTLVWAMYLLSQNPDKQEKLIQEIDSVLKGKEPTYDDLSNLKYVSNVIDETLRIYPTAHGILRSNEYSDEKIMGYDVPKGTAIIISFAMTQKDSEIFKNPDKFEPERFDRPSEIIPFSYTPFGIGNRSCIGKGFAKVEACIFLIKFFQKYRVSMTEEQIKNTKPVVMVTLQPENGCFINVSKRSDAIITEAI